jgi:hypothetical protein
MNDVKKRRKEWLEEIVPCPYCYAGATEHCIGPRGNRVLPHTVRWRAFRKMQEVST